MGHLIFLLVSLALLVGFYALTRYEASRGTRFFAAERARLDADVDRAAFIIEHVDLAAFARDEIRLAATRVGHALAELTLHAVRAIERLLSRLVRYLRIQHADTVMPRESTREFVKTLSDFKEGLKETPHEIPDIQ